TSTKQGEGKSFLILCLAYSLSLIKKRILIIDTNFKNNSLTELLLAPASMDKLLEANNTMSARLLPAGDAGMAPDDDFVKNIINRTGHENIDVIGSSVGTSSPSEIFSGRDFRNMLDIVSMNYDYVFMEGPSLNKYPDTKELLAYVDKVIPVFSADSVIKQVDSESIEFLKTLNGQFLGAILNNVETKLMVTK
ncbi:MAG: AAA family ATPase, partial [Cytophagales bacterium]|nr:AAA family ATPase [Cytophagales bacterium]